MFLVEFLRDMFNFNTLQFQKANFWHARKPVFTIKTEDL